MGIESQSSRAKALNALAHKLPPKLLPQAIAAARDISDKSSRTKTLSALALRLLEIPVTELFPLWQETLHKLALHNRKDLLEDINALAPIIFKLGNLAAVTEVITAIEDVARWWR
jgi:hypothetical protein